MIAIRVIAKSKLMEEDFVVVGIVDKLAVYDFIQFSIDIDISSIKLFNSLLRHKLYSVT